MCEEHREIKLRNAAVDVEELAWVEFVKYRDSTHRYVEKADFIAGFLSGWGS